MTSDPPHDPFSHPPFAVTADIAMFTIREGRFQLLLVERGKPPFLGRLALPGGFLHPDEDAETTARRELLEETALDAGTGHLEQLRTYSTPGRDPRQRVVTVAFWAILPALGSVHGGTDARTADSFRSKNSKPTSPLPALAATWPSTTTGSPPTPSSVHAPSSSTRRSPPASAHTSSR